MFVAVMVHLQGKRCAGLNLDPLDLEAVAFFKHRIRAPRAMHRAVELVGFVAGRFQLRVDVFDILRPCAIGHQQGVRRIDNHQITDTDRAHQALAALHVAVIGVVENRLAHHAVTACVRRRQRADGIPRADVTPTDVARHDRRAGGFFHYGVVD